MQAGQKFRPVAGVLNGFKVNDALNCPVLGIGFCQIQVAYQQPGSKVCVPLQGVSGDEDGGAVLLGNKRLRMKWAYVLGDGRNEGF